MYESDLILGLWERKEILMTTADFLTRPVKIYQIVGPCL